MAAHRPGKHKTPTAFPRIGVLILCLNTDLFVPKVGTIGGARNEARPKVGPIGGARNEARPKGIRTPNLLIRSNLLDPTRHDPARPHLPVAAASPQVTALQTDPVASRRKLSDRYPNRRRREFLSPFLIQPTMTTTRVRGPWTPSTRCSSMSLVALGPLIQVSGRC